MKRALLLPVLLTASLAGRLEGLDYPGTPPGTAERRVTSERAILTNAALRGEWEFDDGRIARLRFVNRHTGRSLLLESGHLPRVVLGDGSSIDLASLEPGEPPVLSEQAVTATFRHGASGLELCWSATLDDDANAIIQSLRLSASVDVTIREIVFLDTVIDGARQVGEVDGSVVVCDGIFMAVEHPLARNTVDRQGRIRCALPRGNVLPAGETWTWTSSIGVVPPGQLRRGFLYYLENRRAHPYRPFLHYNNWYNVWLARPVERTNEVECLETLEIFGREFIRGRGVRMDAFVWDDGWDDPDSLWRFHRGFPDGFRKLDAAGRKLGVTQGVWISPWGGYGPAKRKRIAFGKARGYETHAGGFSMAGEKYGGAFRDVCRGMMCENGVAFFKFDGMGGGNEVTGAGAGRADDIDAVLELTRVLRREKSEVFISATIGTWASPFWTFFADSIWRQGGDNGLHGAGNTRQQWITYRDKFCHDRIVKLGPLYPLNSLMLHGVLIGDRRSPARLVRDEKSIADEIWSFFGSGTCLQELYVNPRILTPETWDQLAAAAKWSRANRSVLVDTHWVGGNPGEEEVYGWASWQPGKGILVLRNPSGSPRDFTTSLGVVLELPEGAGNRFVPKPVYGVKPNFAKTTIEAGEPVEFTLAPFEVVVVELREARSAAPQPDGREQRPTE